MKLALTRKEFGGRPLLAPLNLEVSPGEFLTLTGASGSGKTTLLRIIAGLDQDWQGRLSLGPLAPVCLMFQEPRLMPWLTVEGNMQLIGCDNDTTQKLLDRVGLTGEHDKYPNQLSGGMQRRVALARALAMKPRLLLMDEPFAALDPVTADACRNLLLECWQDLNFSVFFVTHDLAEARLLGQRQLILEGQPAQLFEG